MCPSARPARRRSPGLVDEVALTLPDEAGGIAIDVGAVRIGLRLVGQNVGEPRPPTVLHLAADPRARVGPPPGEGGPRRAQKACRKASLPPSPMLSTNFWLPLKAMSEGPRTSPSSFMIDGSL